VPEIMRGRFFEKYATSGKENGSGLGTYSARLITEAHGGSIAMTTSEVTDTLTIVLPAK
jgi:nitrogen-specific signal transduction histidine kinase